MAKHEGFEQSDSDPLPYTQVDRAVKTKAALLAGRLQVTNQHALGSLVEFWDLNGDPRELEKLVITGKNKVVLTGEQVRLRFELASGKSVEPVALVALGVLEQEAPDAFRVRGMSRFFAPVKARLQARTAASLGGKKSAEARRKKTGSAQPIGGRGSEAASVSAQATTEPNTEPNTEATSEADSEAPPKRNGTQRSTVSGQRASSSKSFAGKQPPAPRLHPLQLRLEQAYLEVRREKYRHGGAKDTEGLKSLLPIATDEVIEARWRWGLVSTDNWKSCSTFAQLAQKWTDLAAPGAAKVGAPVDPSTQGWRTDGEITAREEEF